MTVKGAVPLGVSFADVRSLITPPFLVRPAGSPLEPKIQLVEVPAQPASVEQLQAPVAPLPPALAQFPARRNPMTPATALPDQQRPVAHFTPLPTMAIPVE